MALKNQLPDEELAEVGILCAHFIEAHLGDELLEVERILCEERHSLLPGIEPDCAGDHLLNLPGISPPRHSV